MSSEASTLRELFETARELRGQARVDFLARVDAARRPQLERLLAADEDDGDGVLAGDPTALVHALSEPAPPPLPFAGQRIGAWELLALLGEGGSSTVFRAARELAGVRQEAALKLLRRGLYTVDAQRQFRRERQALAQLRHPDIASLIEGGVTDAGLAYIALELVNGAPITDYARERNLDLNARLRLFQRVCRAVEAAHRALIVHRDLKPSNVLVSAEGHVKLLDFGIAKLLDAEDETQTRLPAFTPAYAAPEQRSGGLVTTATDVYALGILLGELITGQRLNDGSGHTPSGQVQNDNAPGVLPAAPRVVRKLLRGDLDNIVLKALATESERRYASAGAFADDIERFLDGQPVAAHPPSRWYRASKFIERHRIGVAATAVFTVAILAALGLALWQANVARREALRANAQAARADQTKNFLVGLFSGLDPGIAPEKRPTLEQIFEDGITDVRRDQSVDPQLRVELLAIAGNVLYRLGQRQRGLDLVGEAVADGEAHTPVDAEAYLQAVATLSHMDFREGRLELAETRLKTALARAGGQTHASRARAAILAELGPIARTRGDLDSATRYLEAAEAMYTRSSPQPADEFMFTTRSELAFTYAQTSRFEQAARLQREVLAQSEQRYGSENETSARLMGDLADNLNHLGRWSEALSLLQRSGSFLRRSLPAPNPSFANWLYSIGWVLADQRLDRLAERMFAEADAIMIARFGADLPLAFGPRIWMADSWTRLGRAAAARPALEHMLELHLAQPHPGPPRTALLRLHLGRALLALGQAQLAREQAEQALTALRQANSGKTSELDALSLLARSQAALGENQAALQTARDVAAAGDAAFAKGNSARIRALLLLAELLRADAQQALTLYRQAVDEIAAAPEPPLALAIEAHTGLADLAGATGNAGAADTERATVAALRQQFDEHERNIQAALDAWLATGPPYK